MRDYRQGGVWRSNIPWNSSNSRRTAKFASMRQSARNSSRILISGSGLLAARAAETTGAATRCPRLILTPNPFASEATGGMTGVRTSVSGSLLATERRLRLPGLPLAAQLRRICQRGASAASSVVQASSPRGRLSAGRTAGRAGESAKERTRCLITKCALSRLRPACCVCRAGRPLLVQAAFQIFWLNRRSTVC